MLFGASVVTVLALLVYFVITINVSRARAKYKVSPPATTGDPNFERALRVQQNTVEQLVFFLPLLWLFCDHVSDLWGSLLGLFWVVGRILYAWGYYQAPEQRIIGFGINSLSAMILLLGNLIFLVISGIDKFS